MRTQHLIALFVLIVGALVLAAEDAAAQPNPTAPQNTPSAQNPDDAQPDQTSAPAASAPPTPPGEADKPAPQPSTTAPGSTDSANTANSTTTAPPAAGANPTEPALPPVEVEAQGTCRTPRQAWIQLLYWLQHGERWEPQKAAACFDSSRLRDPVELAKRAELLKEIVDGRNARIDIDKLPTEPEYTEESSGLQRYLEPIVARQVSHKIYLIRDSNTGRWLFSPETIAIIPELHPQTLRQFRDNLPSWLRFSIFGIELWKYLSLILLVVLANIVKWMVVMVLGRYMRGLIHRTNITYLARLSERAERPISGLVMAIVFYVGIPALLLPIRITEILMVGINALAAFSGVWLGYRLIDLVSDFLLSRAAKTESKLDDQLVPLVSKSLKVFVSVVGGIFILQNLGINVGSLLAGLGIGGLAFALAAKDTIANLFGSLMIFIDKPFQIGDWVVIGPTEGIVEEVGFRTSRVRTFYNSLITVPNAQITNMTVDNYGARSYRRYSTTLGLTYDTPPQKVEAFCEGLRALIARTPGMRKDYYLIEFSEFGATSLVIMVYCFMDSPSWNAEMRTRTNLNLDILRLAEALGVSFAFPTQTLHVNSMAQPGTSLPGPNGPQAAEELAQVITDFGPGGSRGFPKGIVLAKNYDCDAQDKNNDDQN